MEHARLFGKLTLKAKIIGLAAVLLMALAGTGLFALATMAQINEELVAIAEEDIPLTQALSHVTTAQLEQAVTFERTLRLGQLVTGEPGHRKPFDEAVAAFGHHGDAVLKGLDGGEALAAAAIGRAHDPDARAEFERVLAGLEAIERDYRSYQDHAREALQVMAAGDVQQASALASRAEAEEAGIDEGLHALLAEIETFTAASAKLAEAHEQHAARVMYIILFTALVVGLVVAFAVIRDALRRIDYAISVAETVAAGDLRAPVTGAGSDEIGRLLGALGDMRDSLHGMIMQLHESSNGLAVAAEELSTASNQMSVSVEGQRGELQQAATAFNQMSATVRDVASSAGNAADATRSARQAAGDGKEVICAAVGTIRELADTVDHAAGVVERVGQDSEGIGAVVDVIKAIAEQTNLLALNAAIEAARAGEQGRGFAVVADEVRTLAQRTQASTQEIEDMIGRLQGSARDAVTSMSDGRDRAQRGVEQALAAGNSFETISDAIGEISGMNTQIAGAAEEQTAVTEDINRNLTAISEGAEQNASAMVQTSGASDELARMAASLQVMVGRFQVA